jgi:hypothetical protein
VTTQAITAGDDLVILGTNIGTGALTSGSRERATLDRGNGAADLLAQSRLTGTELTGGGYVFAMRAATSRPAARSPATMTSRCGQAARSRPRRSPRATTSSSVPGPASRRER